MDACKQIPLLSGLSPAETEKVKACLREKKYSKGETLFLEGAGCQRIFFVKSGRVKLSRNTQEGKEQILEILDSGKTCACNPGRAEWYCSASAEAVEDTEVWFLAAEDYGRLLMQSPVLARKLNELFAEKIRCLSSLVEEVTLKDARKRLIKFLLDMEAEKSGKSAQKVLFLPFTRQEIAQRLGMARETVARYLHQLKREELIEIKPYQIIILDRAGLQNKLN